MVSEHEATLQKHCIAQTSELPRSTCKFSYFLLLIFFNPFSDLEEDCGIIQHARDILSHILGREMFWGQIE